MASARLLAVFAGIALVSSACSTSRVSQYAPLPNVSPIARAGAATAAAEAKPPKRVSTAGALETPRPPPQPSAYPNINKVPERVKGKLLTADEKAKVIAELEALAQAQAAPVAAASQAAKAACDNQVAQALDPEKPIRKEGDGQQC